MLKKRKSKKQNYKNKEIDDVKVYSENLVKNLVNEASENSKNVALFEKQYEEDFYTKEIGLSKNTYSSGLGQRKSLEKYKNDFFEDFDDEEEKSNDINFFKVISITLIILLSISTLILSISMIKTKSSLAESKSQLQELLDNSENIEEKLLEEDLKEEIAKLETENNELKQALEEINVEDNINNTNEEVDNTQIQSEETIENTTNENSTTNSNNNEYTIQKGDTIWDISKKVYGNGAEYQKILDANGLTENSVLQEGTKIVIP